MNIPGFTAENSTCKTNNHFQSTSIRSFGNGNNDSQVYLQKPNKDNTTGGKCHATSSDGTINVGTYDSEGWCCAPKPGGKTCINCDSPNNTCGDGDAPKRGIFDRFTGGNFLNGIFARV